MWHFLYQLTLVAAAGVAGPFFLLRRRRHYGSSLLRRLGFGAPSAAQEKGRLWIHAVSVGEVGVAATLAPHLPPSLPLLVTTVTPTGQQRAKERFPDALVTYLPFDLGYLVRAFFVRFDPRILLLSEGDLWPTVLRQARRRGVPVIVINGRISDRSFARMRRLRWFLGPLFEPVSHFGMQTNDDKQRLLRLGVPPEKVTVTGNLKFESPKPPPAPELDALVHRVAHGRSILIAGSTMQGEEELLLRAFTVLREHSDAVLIVAPRHPERWDSVAGLIDRTGLKWARRSALNVGEEELDIVLLDSLGELASLYRLASVAFIGGTLVPTGGHNPLEAAQFGIPVVIGPSMHNFAEIAAAFDSAEAWKRVATADDLARCWLSWLAEPNEARAVGGRGQRLLEHHQGALERTLDMLGPWLQSLAETS